MAPKSMEHASRAACWSPDPCSLSPYRRATFKALKAHPASPRGKRGVVSLVFLDALSGSSSEATTHFCLWLEKPEALFLTVSPFHLPHSLSLRSWTWPV